MASASFGHKAEQIESLKAVSQACKAMQDEACLNERDSMNVWQVHIYIL